LSSTVLAAGCGTQHFTSVKNQPVDLAAAVTHTQDQTARIAATITTQTQGMTVSFTETGLFDFARSRGTITMQSPVGMTEIFVPPKTYIKLPADVSDSGGSGLPKGKSWIALPDAMAGAAGAGGLLGPMDGSGDPADLLASLTAAASSVTKLGPSVIRGVPVTGFALKIDPAKAGAVPGADRAEVAAFLKSFDAAAIPVDVWVDGQNLVRRESLSLAMPSGSGAPAGTKLTWTTDFYDFGVPVRVSAPPASQVADEGSKFALGSGGASGSGSGSSGSSYASPPAVSGTLTPDQASAAEQAVTAFWAAVGRNNTAAVAATVVPAQRSCVQSSVGSGSGAPTISVSDLHVTSAQPAGNSSATVRFTVKAEASLGGQDLAVLQQASGSAPWLVTTEVAGHWYVNLDASTALAFGGGCD
jgi:hypothetical protein